MSVDTGFYHLQPPVSREEFLASMPECWNGANSVNLLEDGTALPDTAVEAAAVAIFEGQAPAGFEYSVLVRTYGLIGAIGMAIQHRRASVK